MSIDWNAIDWNETAAMTQAIFSIIAIGVAIALAQVQHNRALALVREERDERRRAADHETKILAAWIAQIIFDLRIRARLVKPVVESFQMPEGAPDAVFPSAAAAELAAFMSGTRLNLSATSPHILDVLPRFNEQAGMLLMPVLRRAAKYDVRAEEIGVLVRTNQFKKSSILSAIDAQHLTLELIETDTGKAYEALATCYGLQSLEDRENEWRQHIAEARAARPKRG